MPQAPSHRPANSGADPAGAPHFDNEADIGSGEKTPGQKETEEHIRQIPPLPGNGDKKSPEPGRTA